MKGRTFITLNLTALLLAPLAFGAGMPQAAPAARPLSAEPAAPAQGAAQAWEKLAGQTSGVKEARTVVVTNEEAWKELWKQHTSNIQEPPPLPSVDFKKEIVVGVFSGEKTSGGYGLSVELQPTQTAKPDLVVTYQEKKPAGQDTLTVMSQPFELRKVPRLYSKVLFTTPQGQSVPFSVPDQGKAQGQERARLAQAGVRTSAVGLSGTVKSLSVSFKDPAQHHALFDGAAGRGAGSPVAASAEAEGGRTLLAQLPPPPGNSGRTLPPPPGNSSGGKPQPGKPLPPPPGSNDDPDQPGKPLPPPPGHGGDQPGKPLPPPPGQRPLPQPLYPGGPLPHDDQRLIGAERAFSTWNMHYLGYWRGDVVTKTDEGRVVTKPEDKTNVYEMRLESGRYQEYVEFYNDSENKIYWTKTERLLSSQSRKLVVEFVNRNENPLFPWEKESFVFSLTGSNVQLSASDSSYRYDVSYTVSDSHRDTVSVAMKATDRKLTPPDPAGVQAGIKVSGDGLKLVVTDKWAQYYAGEKLEVKLSVYKSSGHWYRRDTKVFDGAASLDTQGIMEYDISAPGPGKYYLYEWSFRRVGSKISRPDWVYKGKGNTVTK